MKYNYPLIPDDAMKVHELIAQQPNDGSFMNIIWVFIIAFLIFSVVLALVGEGAVADLSFVLILIGIPVFLTALISPNEEEQWKKEIIYASSASLENPEGYSSFQNSVMRYLQTHDIELAQNCSTLDPYTKDDYSNQQPIGSPSDVDPSDTIMCSKYKKKLAGTAVFVDNNNKRKVFVYNTSINSDNDYLEFTLEEKNNAV